MHESLSAFNSDQDSSFIVKSQVVSSLFLSCLNLLIRILSPLEAAIKRHRWSQIVVWTADSVVSAWSHINLSTRELVWKFLFWIWTYRLQWAVGLPRGFTRSYCLSVEGLPKISLPVRRRLDSHWHLQWRRPVHAPRLSAVARQAIKLIPDFLDRFCFFRFGILYVFLHLEINTYFRRRRPLFIPPNKRYQMKLISKESFSRR